MTFAYDSLGRMQNATYPDGEAVAYVYDRGGNLESVASPARTYVSNIQYDHFGRRRRVRNGNGTETVYTFDAVMQRLEKTDTTADSGATALQTLSYRYNRVGLIDRIENAITPGGMRGSSLHEYSYDEHEQLVGAVGSFHHASGDERRYTLAMEYDSIGRITRMNQQDQTLPSGGGAPITVTETTRDNAYVYAGPRVHAASQVGGNEYGYDGNGNQSWRYNATSGEWRALSWDDEDRLVGAFVPTASEYFNYDAGGARTHKTDYTETTLYPSAFVTVRNGGEVTKHVWAGGERVGSVVRPDGGGVGDERAYWTHNDHLGGGHYVTTSVGAVYEMAERLPFGENWVSARAGSDRVAAGFAGSEHHESIGLNYHGARYYDAREARWTARDPALEEYMAGGGVFDPRNLGLYAYAFNSPVSYWDPDGRTTVDAAGDADASSPADSGPAPGEFRVVFDDGVTRVTTNMPDGEVLSDGGRTARPPPGVRAYVMHRAGLPARHPRVDVNVWARSGMLNELPDGTVRQAPFRATFTAVNPNDSLDVEQYMAETAYIEDPDGTRHFVEYRVQNTPGNNFVFETNHSPNAPAWSQDSQGNPPGDRRYFIDGHGLFGRASLGFRIRASGASAIHSLTVIDAPDTIPATARVALSNYLRAHPGATVAGSRIILRNDFATYGRVNGAVEVRIDWAREQAFRIDSSGVDEIEDDYPRTWVIGVTPVAQLEAAHRDAPRLQPR